MKERELLENLDLTPNEIDIYLYLLKTGSSPGPQIYKELSLDKSSTYRALSELEKKDLIYSLGETRNQLFLANSTDKLLKMQEAKEKEVLGIRKGLKKFIKNIDEFSKKNYKFQNIKIFEGKNAYYAFMEESRKGKYDVFRNICSTQKIHKLAHTKERYYKYMESYVPERVKKGIKVKILYDKNTKPDFLDVSDAEKLKEARQYKGNLSLGCFLNTFANKTGFLTLRNGEPWAIIIEDQLITDLINSLFEAIWNISKTI
ncbi:hypothetical protein JW710_03385 [Candidatus Dojkabacteria bacterium]|nr:hypothetical protein [Candidatus Dojkabacteria bacterium]